MTRFVRVAPIGVAAVAWCAGAGACSVAESPEAGVEPRVGGALPAMGLSGEWPALVWVFAVEQCLGCELGDLARTIRALQRRLGERIETVVVAVGAGREDDERLVHDFLASQRISARVETWTAEQHRRGFGSAPPPVLYVANRRAVIEAVVEADPAGSRRSAGPGRDRDLVRFIERIANRGIESAGKGSGMQE